MNVFRTLLASLVLLVAGISVLGFVTDGFRAYTTETARRIGIKERPPVIPAFALQTADGSQTNFGALRGRWLLVDFIYTRCQTYCSAQGNEFANLQRRLARPITAGKLALVSISFDPRDQPKQLADYQHRFGDGGFGWIAARPIGHDDRAALLRAFGVTAVPDGLGGFVHNAAVNVISPDGKLVAILDWDDPHEAIRYITQRLMS